MISYYPPLLFPYLNFRKRNPPSAYPTFFFQSWEDALWHLIDQGVIKKGVSLVPDFYCLDVIDNMRSHGLEPVYYRLDNNLQPDIKEIMQLLKTYQPTSLIIFHACGIESILIQNSLWRKELTDDAAVINDCVHWLLEPYKVKLHSTQDVAIDSLRKNCALSGSFVYLPPTIAEFIQPPQNSHKLYTMSARMQYLCFRTTLTIGTHLRLPFLIKLGHHRILKKHDNLIGDSQHGNRGPTLSRQIYQYMNFVKIQRIKAKQAKLYKKYLTPILLQCKRLSVPVYSRAEDLHAFPLIVTSNLVNVLEKSLYNLNVWTKFPDAPWSKTRKVFLLPLGPHITIQDQRCIATVIQKAVLSRSRTRAGHTKSISRSAPRSVPKLQRWPLQRGT